MSGRTPPTYAYAIHDVAGVVAANNFVSFFNPVTSGKIVLAIQALVTTYAVGASSTASSMIVRFVTAASGGSLVAASDIYRLRSDWGDPSLVVRTGNPTVTTKYSHSLATFPPPLSTGVGGNTAGVATAPAAGGVPFLPGEGFVYHTDAGNTNQRWSIQFIWAEVDI